MITRIQKILRQSVKDFNVTSDLNSEEALVTLLAADLYRNLVIQPAEQAITQTKSRRKKGDDGIHQA